MEKELYFSNVIGVSTGVYHGSSYIAKQKGRDRNATIDYIQHLKYISYQNLFENKELIGMGYLFDEIT